MLPAYPAHDAVEIGVGRSKLLRHFVPVSAGCNSTANLSYLVFGEFGGESAKTSSVRRVLDLLSPAKIAQGVVRWIAIQVSAFHSFRAWTDKDFKNQAVQEERMPLTFLGYIKAKVGPSGAAATMNKRLHLSPVIHHYRPSAGTVPARPERTIGASTVAWKVWMVAVLDSRLSLRHGGPSFQGSVCLGQAGGSHSAGLSGSILGFLAVGSM